VPYDPAKAKQLLAEAGVRPGLAITIPTFAGGPEVVDVAQLLKQDLDALGFQVTIQPLQGVALLEVLNAPVERSSWLLAIASPSAQYLDAEALLFRVFLSTASQNWARYKNTQVDALISEQSATVDPATRKQLLARIQRIIWDDLPLFPLVVTKGSFAVSKTVRDVELISIASVLFSRTWLAQ
jgi:ABC-type transport system substrate-binding protein